MIDNSNPKNVEKIPNKDYHGSEKAKECTPEYPVASKPKGDTKLFTTRSHGFLGAGKILSGKLTVLVPK